MKISFKSSEHLQTNFYYIIYVCKIVIYIMIKKWNFKSSEKKYGEKTINQIYFMMSLLKNDMILFL